MWSIFAALFSPKWEHKRTFKYWLMGLFITLTHTWHFTFSPRVKWAETFKQCLRSVDPQQSRYVILAREMLSYRSFAIVSCVCFCFLLVMVLLNCWVTMNCSKVILCFNCIRFPTYPLPLFKLNGFQPAALSRFWSYCYLWMFALHRVSCWWSRQS